MFKMEEIKELYLYLTNKEEFYSFLMNIESNLYKKIKKGIFNAEKAEKAFYNVVTNAAKDYCKNFGGIYYQVFTVKTRKEVCKELVNNFLEN